MDDANLSTMRPEDRHQQMFAQMSRRLMRKLEAADFAGWDPFDALNSKLFNATPLSNSPAARLVWTQVFKRNPFNLRPLVSIPKTANPVTIALAAETFRRDHAMERSRLLVRRLLTMAVVPEGDGSRAWGYPFAWQAKAFYVPNGAANVIATAYAVRELVHWRAENGVDQAIAGAAALVASRFGRRGKDDARYIAYVQNSDAMVHNASLWGAYVLAEGWRITGKDEWLQLAGDAVAHSLSAQRRDGSWPYGEAAHHQFTDGFHTGYVLEALHRIRMISSRIDADAAIERGIAYYLGNLIEPDGTAKYYSQKRFPLDGNCAAQAVITLDALDLAPRHSDLCKRIMQRAIDHLWLENSGRFAYQRNSWFMNSLDYPRWTQIWLALALQIVAGTATTASAENRAALQASAA